MSAPYDVIVLGAGHNGLTAAARLAQKGRKVLVLERWEVVGGIAAREEFHPGFAGTGPAHDTSRVREDVVAALGLEPHGLTLSPAPPARLALGVEETGLLLGGDVGDAAREIERVSPSDARRYVAFWERVGRLRDVVRSFLRESPVDLLQPQSAGAWNLLRRGLRARRLGRHDLHELLRLPPMSAADWLDEWFETGELKASLALPAVAGGFTGPRSPGTNTNLLFAVCDADVGIAGGATALVEALHAAARSHGAEIRTGAPVARLLPQDGNLRVVLEDGQEISARAVAASCHPRHLFCELLPAGAVSQRMEHRIRKYRSRGTTGHLLLAVEGPVRFAARRETPIEFAATGDDLDELERAFDAVKYGQFADRPVLDVHVPTVSRPDLAPAGNSVVSVLVHFVPYDLRSGWTDAARERLEDLVMRRLESLVPGLRAATVGRTLRTPPDLEARYGLHGGSVTHGEHSLDQLLVRPVAGCADYRTPIRGLYLCGGASHPGGGLTCGPGYLAAEAVLAGDRR